LISAFSFDAIDFFGDFGETGFATVLVVDFFALVTGFFLAAGLAFLVSTGFFGLRDLTGETCLGLEAGDRAVLVVAIKYNPIIL